MSNKHYDYWERIWKRFKKKRIGFFGFILVIIFCMVGIYAPILASSNPFFVYYDGSWYFPWFKYLFFKGYYTKNLDIFFNIMMITIPMLLGGLLAFKNQSKKNIFLIFFLIQFAAFFYCINFNTKDPQSDPELNKQRQEALRTKKALSWNFDLAYLNDYAKLNMLIRYKLRKEQEEHIQKKLENPKEHLATLWQIDRSNEDQEKKRLKEYLEEYKEKKNQDSQYIETVNKLKYLEDRHQWLEKQSQQLQWMAMPLVSHFHWEEDAGGSQALNQKVPWYDLTRINRKDLISALIFGTRISLIVGIIAVGISLLIGIPIGSLAGYYGGKFDIITCRLLEIWESMPSFLMLLMIVAITQSKSIFLVISVIGIFGWTSFSRYIRGEFFKQRNLSYVEACHSLGFKDLYIIFVHILPNAIPPILTLLPFAIMGAITSEAGLSFLGLGEENSCSWGVLMDEGRTAFPGESYLLWPPAFLLTMLLVAIALVGDSLRDVLDPKTQ